MYQLEGKIALITGAKGGLGSHVTEAFLAAGATVLGVSRSIRDTDFVHPRFAAFPAELSSGDSARQLVGQVTARFPRIDALVHVIGGFEGGATIDETNDATFERMLDLNYRSAFFIIRTVLPHLRRDGGRVLAVASRQAVEPAPMVGAYSASKAALVSLVRTVSLENRASGITANSVLPATMDTPANRAAMPTADFSQWVRPADVAALLVHLASDAGAAINGAAIGVYGGQS
ncbi:MAG TPA: SDR family NAD(P)-dependent oxidoreductase [Bryobacteraceae bacterium]|nr:SDR family NAD(P)-dependent oxidoreductase [Bryobacteraceae bacterium]